MVWVSEKKSSILNLKTRCHKKEWFVAQIFGSHQKSDSSLSRVCETKEWFVAQNLFCIMERQLQFAAYLAFIYIFNFPVLEFPYCMFVKGDEPSYLKLNLTYSLYFQLNWVLEHISSLKDQTVLLQLGDSASLGTSKSTGTGIHGTC